MAAYYNEIDPFAAAWLRELIKAGLIADGEVDERSIADVRADDVRGFTQCHFFAGIGGWSYALRLANWSDMRPVWTGSCPCQSYSSAGKGKGAADARNLWPAWFRLIQKRRPRHVFGEQVASAAGHGWLDAISTDMEAEDYAIGAVLLGAHSIGAPHIRQRLWFAAERPERTQFHCPFRCRAICQDCEEFEKQLADAERGPAERHRFALAATARGTETTAPEWEWLRDDAWDGGEPRPLDQSECERAERAAGSEGRAQRETPSGGQNERRGLLQVEHASALDDVGHAIVHGLQGSAEQALQRARRRQEGSAVGQSSGSPWAGAEWLACRDGKARPVEPGTFPLAHGVSARVGRLRGYGNAIVPQVAAEFIGAYMDVQGSR